ncbi:hypothetical protein PPL_05363 [Heterostelium album PN500]|uniref:Fe2OG dioxygenase domain-containing protein n=1 Tax=Heterostelium pallidum (strain ATCC 26659 / Pp 5 / PN500) TaxID=670386 RepID=D3B9Z2_HETP5|nr:hypothetical protein PPL_05363 [Heterostelium album PN500]EFA81379.1 hypothetical protein PPL_05363 [Heterostelium album PN500]|eukprot:XP_020433497.1 hypothetical protein PPL_05363 [Heterostelium album PN500]
MISTNSNNINTIELKNDSWIKFTPNFLDEANAKLLDGNDFIGMHADDEAYLPGKTTIASISLGATRTFTVTHSKKKETQEYKLNNGSLIVMGGQCQKNYRHGIPKEPDVVTPRINLTFRKS